jgi:hypothetical protein
LAVALTLAQSPMAPARAQDSSNDLLVIAKSSLLGGLVGLVLGGVTALVVDSDDRDDAVRWGIVLGTFGGFGYGVYTVSTGGDDDFFGALPPDGSSPMSWQRPLPGAELGDRFANLSGETTTQPRALDPFRSSSLELMPIASDSGD